MKSTYSTESQVENDDGIMAFIFAFLKTFSNTMKKHLKKFILKLSTLCSSNYKNLNFTFLFKSQLYGVFYFKTSNDKYHIHGMILLVLL